MSTTDPKEEKAQQSRKTRHIQPLGMRVLVRIQKEERLESGLYLPDGAKDQMHEALYGEVVEVARTLPDEEQGDVSLGTNVSGIPCGAHVLFPKQHGIPVPWDETLRLLEVKHVLATVEEVALDTTH